MNKKFMLIASAVTLLGSFSEAAMINIEGLKFNHSKGDAAATVSSSKIMVDGKEDKDAALFFQEGKLPPVVDTAATTPVAMGLVLDMDGDTVNTTNDQVKFDLGVVGSMKKGDSALSAKPVHFESNKWEFNKASGLSSIEKSGITNVRYLEFTFGSVKDAENAAGKVGLDQILFTGADATPGEKISVDGAEQPEISGDEYTHTFTAAPLGAEQTVSLSKSGPTSFNPSEFNLSMDVAAIPEPATFGLLGLASAGLLAYRRRSKR